MNEHKGHYFYITFVHAVSALAVVTLHTNGCFWSFSRERYWFTANIIESVFYFAVPLFFMVTGITLIDYPKRYSLIGYFERRMVKTVLPFLAWSLIGLIYRLLVGSMSLDRLDYAGIMNAILKTEIVSIYWFFPPLFRVYLCMPLFAAVPEDRRRTVFAYLFCAGLLFNVTIPFIKAVFHLDVTTPLSLSVVSEHLIYVVGGVLLHENPLNQRQRYALYALGLMGLMAHIIGTYALSMRSGEIVRTYKGYTNLPCIVYSLAVFTLLREIAQRMKNGITMRTIMVLGRYTFPMYLMHWFILDLTKRVFHVNVTSIVYRLGMPLVVLVVVTVVTEILRKIPVIKKIVP